MIKLLKWADVICNNFRPGIMDKLGYSYEFCSSINPKIIYASNSGFGDKGDWAERPSFDGVSQAFSGVLTQQAGGPSQTPVPVDFAFSDESGAANFAFSIVTALLARARTGKGQEIVTNQTAATLHFSRFMIHNAFVSKFSFFNYICDKSIHI